LADFHEILPEQICWDNNKQKSVRKFGYLTYFSHGVHLGNMSCIFLAIPTLDADI